MSIRIASRNHQQQPQRMQYRGNEENRSRVLSEPRQQLIKAQHIDAISDEVETVLDVKKENFDPQANKNIAKVIIAAAVVSIIAAGILAISFATSGVVATSLIGVGIGLATISALGVGAVGIANHVTANNQLEKQEEVDNLGKAAIRHLVAEKIDELSDGDAEPPVVQSPRRNGPDRVADRPEFHRAEPRRSEVSSVTKNDDILLV